MSASLTFTILMLKLLEPQAGSYIDPCSDGGRQVTVKCPFSSAFPSTTVLLHL